ncbi:hypothetical protein FLL45_01975 [Aliikangiella marina]|uniref:Calcineurin-like phosphoesterase domain-containing protein n=1 Tax=Aliikangiella marina TaxID=1712262 RepID=A0A545THP3_9GAMM|nr:metallophosphoesterase [Aliikangiella marina]TQV76749.1 hypothetical protein FLL45_01975 [Aliikangiella marina]
MKKELMTFSKHFVISCLLLLTSAIIFGISIGASAHFGDNPLAVKLAGEGPHVFIQDQTLKINYIRGDRDEGFYVDSETFSIESKPNAKTHFALENNAFEFQLDANFKIPAAVYNDNAPILAISDIESGFKTFRDFLIANKVINDQLEWTFGKGHLVLVGDFVDRGFSTTQVLWFIYKLEQQAKQHGGLVHFILGNHEIKNLQGNFKKAKEKYFHVAGILDKQQHELYGENSFIGRWMSHKNTVELINGYLFVHGGIHPKTPQFTTSIEEINQIVRNNYRKLYFPQGEKNKTQFLTSTTTGPSWYRGYFKSDIDAQDVRKTLEAFNAKAVIVGHTIQSKVNKQFDGQVIAIDVAHPKDYRNSFPFRSSEGLLIKHEKIYRVLANGEQILL